jgi:hypothetical protein
LGGEERFRKISLPPCEEETMPGDVDEMDEMDEMDEKDEKGM